MPTLMIQLPGLPSVEHIVREDAITLGRMKGNSISLNESSVSLSHAKITRIGNDFFLKDLNSTNGTMLNGQSVTEARLRDGDQLKFGEVVAYFRVEPLGGLVPAPVAAAVPVAGPLIAPVVAAPVPLKPTAQSVPVPAVAPAMIASATLSPAPGACPLVPQPKTPVGRKSLRMPLLISCAVLGLAALGFLSWKFFFDRPAPVVVPPVASATLKKPPANNVAAATSPPANATATSSSDQNLAELVKALKSSDVAVRRHAAAAIYNLGPAAISALPALREILADPDADVRMWVALALVHNNVYEKATIPILIQTLHHENPTLRQVACLSLAMIPYTEADKAVVVPALVETANKDSSADVANDALTALKIIAPDLVIGK